MQTADLLRNAAQALGVTTAKLDEVLQWQRHLAQEQKLQGERIAKLEKGEEWTGEERRNVRERLKTGDHTFEAIKQIAVDAQKTADSAKLMLAEVLKRRAADGTRVRSKWVELLKVVAPYIWAAIVGTASWLAAHFTYTGGH
jgi:predicted HNH restriction endonuclease